LIMATWGKGGGKWGKGADPWNAGGPYGWGKGDDWGQASGGAGAGAAPVVDMWGGAGAMYGYGPWATQDPNAKWTPGPVGKSAKERKAEEEAKRLAVYEAKHKGPLPYVEWIRLGPDNEHVKLGFPAVIPVIEFDKGKDIFSDAYKILGDFFLQGAEYVDQASVCEFNHDWDGAQYPEIQAGWKAAGNEEGCFVVATCPQARLWAGGVGGKDKATKAARLGLAVALATASTETEVARVATATPSFGEFLLKAYTSHPESPESQQEQNEQAGAAYATANATASAADSSFASIPRASGPRDTTPVFVQLQGFPDWTEGEDLKCVLLEGGQNISLLHFVEGGVTRVAEMCIQGWKDADIFVMHFHKFEFTPGYPMRARIKPGQERPK